MPTKMLIEDHERGIFKQSREFEFSIMGAGVDGLLWIYVGEEHTMHWIGQKIKITDPGTFASKMYTIEKIWREPQLVGLKEIES